MGFASALFGEKGQDPVKQGKKGLALLPGMENRQLMQSLLMQKMLQGQMVGSNVWEKAAMMKMAESERTASESVSASSKKEAAQNEQAAANAGLSNVTGSVARRKAIAGRGAREKRKLSADRLGQQVGVRQAAYNMRAGTRRQMLGVQDNIQKVKAQSDLQKLHLTTGNTPYGVTPMLKGPKKGLLGTAMGIAGYTMGGGPTGGMIGQSIGDSIGSTFAT